MEVIIAITLLSTLIAISMSKFNFTTKISDNVAADLQSAMTEIETSFGLYQNDKNAAPTGLTDTTFVPIYVMIPKISAAFDNAYGTNGFNLVERTGQASPDNGWYIATKVTISGSNDPNWNAITRIASKLPSTKFYYNTTAPPATSNMAAPSGSTTLYTTYWITRY